MEITRATYQQSAYHEIRQLIVEGHLQPGSKVVVRELSERFGISPTPIKAALSALERDGFLHATPHRGYFVPDVSLTDMREIYELCETLDALAARKVAMLPDHAEFALRTLRPLVERQRNHAGGAQGPCSADTGFHRAIWARSGNQRLASILENLGGQTRLASSLTESTWSPSAALREHEAIKDAVAAGDGDRAALLSAEHARRSLEAFEVAWSSRREA